MKLELGSLEVSQALSPVSHRVGNLLNSLVIQIAGGSEVMNLYRSSTLRLRHWYESLDRS